MTLNIDLEDVPDAILEAVKARIMANRRRLLDRDELLRQPPLQPKPQFRKFGADGRTWKRPQSAAVASGVIALPFFYTYGDGSSSSGGTIYVVSGDLQQTASQAYPPVGYPPEINQAYLNVLINPFANHRRITLSLPLDSSRCLFVLARSAYNLPGLLYDPIQSPGLQLIVDPSKPGGSLINGYVISFLCSYTEARAVDTPVAIRDELFNRMAMIGRGTRIATVLPSYGITDSMTYEYIFNHTHATPAHWFMLNAREEDQLYDGFITSDYTDNPALATHEQIQGFTDDQGVALGSVFRGFHYYALLDQIANASSIARFKSGLPTGNFDQPLSPAYGGDSSLWTTFNNAFRATSYPGGVFASRLYINDWGNPQFCREQAERWGVADL